jgi:hypothetical protein
MPGENAMTAPQTYVIPLDVTVIDENGASQVAPPAAAPVQSGRPPTKRKRRVQPKPQRVTHSMPASPRTTALKADGGVRRFVQAQLINTARNVRALRPFRDEEFGASIATPTQAHIDAANALIARLQGQIVMPSSDQNNLGQLLAERQRGERQIKLLEKIWAFYFELFGQRQSRFGELLLANDRIALDCYQDVFLGLGKARSIPTPAPFSYMETGFTPATFRRGIPLTRLGRQRNAFPIVSLPYHRLINPWTLGATLHEVSHNLQHDLKLWTAIPKAIHQALLEGGFSPTVANVWMRWHKEIYADLSAALLGGPWIVASLIDVVARTPRQTTFFNPAGVHPTSYLRVLISVELLRRMGFNREAESFRRLWTQMYPDASPIPAEILRTADKAMGTVVDVIAYRPYPQLGSKSLSAVFSFRPDYALMVQEAAHRLAHGNDPGVLPERFLVGAARVALDRQLAPPQVVARHFYRALIRR